MIPGFAILDRPLVSSLFEDTLADLGVPVLKNHPQVALRREADLNLLSREEFFSLLESSPRPRLYTNSEDSLGTILQRLAGSDLARQINDAKNKSLMREVLAPLYPDFWYRSESLKTIRRLDPATLPYPLIVKPKVGFLSVAVESVEGPQGWRRALDQVEQQLANAREAFPASVLGPEELLLEQRIPGQEFALDVYFGQEGKPVIVDVMHHLLRGPGDVEDRVYLTTPRLIEERGSFFMPALLRMAEALRFRDFPAHIEFRLDEAGRPIPIEINPLRFAGLGCADLAWYAYGLNPHRAFFLAETPDWPALRARTADRVFSVVILGLPKTLDRSTIRSVHWEQLASSFSNLRELRKVDYRTYPVLGFAFLESPDMDEPRRILDLDLLQFLDCGR